MGHSLIRIIATRAHVRNRGIYSMQVMPYAAKSIHMIGIEHCKGNAESCVHRVFDPFPVYETKGVFINNNFLVIQCFGRLSTLLFIYCFCRRCSNFSFPTFYHQAFIRKVYDVIYSLFSIDFSCASSAFVFIVTFSCFSLAILSHLRSLSRWPFMGE